jgi:hypothetical protein
MQCRIIIMMCRRCAANGSARWSAISRICPLSPAAAGLQRLSPSQQRPSRLAAGGGDADAARRKPSAGGGAAVEVVAALAAQPPLDRRHSTKESLFATISTTPTVATALSLRRTPARTGTGPSTHTCVTTGMAPPLSTALDHTPGRSRAITKQRSCLADWSPIIFTLHVRVLPLALSFYVRQLPRQRHHIPKPMLILYCHDNNRLFVLVNK